MTEAEFQDRVIATARLYGWMVHHTRPARMADGRWRTPVQGDKGFPDLVLAHERHGTVFAELKSDTGRLTPEQKAWLAVLGGVVWRPRDWPHVLAVLQGKELQVG